MEIQKLTEQEMTKLLKTFMLQTSEKTGIPLSVVEEMIYEGQWKAAHIAVKNYKNVEITGLGKFLTREKKTCGLLEKYLRSLEDLCQRQFVKYSQEREVRIAGYEKNINYLLTKLNQEKNVDKFTKQRDSISKPERPDIIEEDE